MGLTTATRCLALAARHNAKQRPGVSRSPRERSAGGARGLHCPWNNQSPPPLRQGRARAPASASASSGCEGSRGRQRAAEPRHT